MSGYPAETPLKQTERWKAQHDPSHPRSIANLNLIELSDATLYC
ncbi:hypothetical protein PSEUDO9AG_50043 [Pseudomonas sp. 9Ag]|uniref:Uncharacterized protein n=1 Tax=Stutzerimonas stutzeri TaxID=316 RepID=A0A5S5BHU4_STUST|nr:hypothetical protein A9A72_122409 [Stutzerimonas stutzeri]VXC83646.1 hypothetical protein PSEUDO9AG_50043 [Pseudomonas sp. 9Ag]